MTQNEALALMKMGRNVFLTGPAGSGKTYVLNAYIAYLRAHRIDVGITASTGIAATHIGGTTIHSWAGVGIKQGLSEKDFKEILKKQYLRSRFDKVRVLLIDEISMLDGKRLDVVDAVCRAFRSDMRPFGGLQVIVCGDFFQLPPVEKDGEKDVDFAFLSRSWKDAKFATCYLSEYHRQDDTAFLDMLKKIRSRTIDDAARASLLERMSNTPSEEEIPHLYTHNFNVDVVNNRMLDALPGKEYTYEMTFSGEAPIAQSLARGSLAPQTLVLKKQAKVMFVKNNFEKGYVNGTLGTVEDFDDEGFPVIRVAAGRRITAAPVEWSIEEGDTKMAGITQIPLRLAWAITIHKSQGMSLDAAEIDLSKSFTPGMGYVALSRVRRLEAITLRGFNDMALAVDDTVFDHDVAFLEESARECAELAQRPMKDHEKTQKAFLKQSEKKTTIFDEIF